MLTPTWLIVHAILVLRDVKHVLLNQVAKVAKRVTTIREDFVKNVIPIAYNVQVRTIVQNAKKTMTLKDTLIKPVQSTVTFANRML